jgi:extradiol dioxygenase family protein
MAVRPFHLAVPTHSIEEARHFYGEVLVGVWRGPLAAAWLLCSCSPAGRQRASRWPSGLRHLPHAVSPSFAPGPQGCPEGRSAKTWVDWNLYGHQVVTHLVQGYNASAHHNAVDGDAGAACSCGGSTTAADTADGGRQVFPPSDTGFVPGCPMELHHSRPA